MIIDNETSLDLVIYSKEQNRINVELLLKMITYLYDTIWAVDDWKRSNT